MPTNLPKNNQFSRVEHQKIEEDGRFERFLGHVSLLNYSISLSASWRTAGINRIQNQEPRAHLRSDCPPTNPQLRSLYKSRSNAAAESSTPHARSFSGSQHSLFLDPCLPLPYLPFEPARPEPEYFLSYALPN